MIDLEDLPRLESLSPIRDIDDDYQNHANIPGMTIIPTTVTETLNPNNNGNMNTATPATVNNISCKTNDDLISSDGNLMTGNETTDRMLNGGSLRYISQVS